MNFSRLQMNSTTLTEGTSSQGASSRAVPLQVHSLRTDLLRQSVPRHPKVSNLEMLVRKVKLPWWKVSQRLFVLAQDGAS